MRCRLIGVRIAKKRSRRGCQAPCLHYSSGSTPGQVVELFNYHLPIKLTPGGLA
ncbi:MAG: hypothetical protein Q4D62_15480 [Planctomycetia bacterium]|nr:hypothetical protein [Planctomycetia bacterium]